MRFFTLILFSVWAWISAKPIQAQQDMQQIFAFSDDTFIENLHVLPNGHLLLSIMRDYDQGDDLIIDPKDPQPAVKTVLTLEGSTGQTGIAPLGGGIYAISGGIHSPFRFELGSMSVYIFSLDDATGSGTLVDTIPVPDTQMLNGMAAIPSSPHILLSADSIGGRIWRIDTQTKVVDVAVTDDQLGPDTDPDNPIPLGANGLKIIDDFLYFTNSAKGTFARFRIDTNGNKISDIVTIAHNAKNFTLAGNAYDDFAIDSKGNAYISMHPWTVNKVTPDGIQTTFIGGSNTTTVKGPTSAVLTNDGQSIYVATGGATIDNQVYGGQILKVKL